MNDELLAELKRRIEAGQDLKRIAVALNMPYHKLYRYLRDRGYRVTRRSELTKVH